MKIVSLGSRCEINILLDQFKIREKNYPLDWNISDDCLSVAHLIQTNFDNFFKEEDQYWSDACNAVGDNKSKIIRPHFYNSMFDWRKDKNKIVRFISLCVDRFNDLQNENCVIFLRQTRANNEGINKIYESLCGRFHNNWHLVLLSDPTEFPVLNSKFENFHEVRFYKKKLEEIGTYASLAYERDSKKLIEILINKNFKDLSNFIPSHGYNNTINSLERWRI